MTAECLICALCFTNVLRKPIECETCKQHACAQCVRKYILAANHDPTCMFCRKIWSHYFVDELSGLSKSFRFGPLTSHHKNILFNEEQEQFENTRPFVRLALDIRNEDDSSKKAEKLKQLKKLMLGQNVSIIEKQTLPILLESYSNDTNVSRCRDFVTMLHLYLPNYVLYYNNVDLRISYLMFNMSKEAFKTQLLRRERKNMRSLCIYDIINRCVNTLTTLLNDKVIKATHDKLQDVIINTNNNFDKLSKRFNNCKRIHITSNYELQHI